MAFFYQTYRYPLGYGYEPPLYWRTGKYLLLLGLCIFSTRMFIKKIKYFGLFERVFLAEFAILTINGLILHEKFLVQGAFCGLVAFWLAVSLHQVQYESMRRFFLFGWVVNTLFYCIEAIGLVFFNKSFFASTGSVITSRFGGMLVEPLGAAYFSFLFLGFSLEYKGVARLFIALTSVIGLFMTQTMTGVFFLTIVICFCVALWALHRMGWLIFSLVFATLMFIVVAAVFGFWYFNGFLPFLAGKWHSVILHASYWWPMRWPWFPANESMFSETWWVFLIQNMGILWSLVYAVIITRLLVVCLQHAKYLLVRRSDGTFNGVFFAVYLSSSYVVFGSLNQLYPAMYPVGFLGILFAFMIKYEKISKNPTDNLV